MCEVGPKRARNIRRRACIETCRRGPRARSCAAFSQPYGCTTLPSNPDRFATTSDHAACSRRTMSRLRTAMSARAELSSAFFARWNRSISHCSVRVNRECSSRIALTFSLIASHCWSSSATFFSFPARPLIFDTCVCRSASEAFALSIAAISFCRALSCSCSAYASILYVFRATRSAQSPFSSLCWRMIAARPCAPSAKVTRCDLSTVFRLLLLSSVKLRESSNTAVEVSCCLPMRLLKVERLAPSSSCNAMTPFDASESGSPASDSSSGGSCTVQEIAFAAPTSCSGQSRKFDRMLLATTIGWEISLCMKSSSILPRFSTNSGANRLRTCFSGSAGRTTPGLPRISSARTRPKSENRCRHDADEPAPVVTIRYVVCFVGPKPSC
mmetsp:Transcript_20866/g.48101  ORF Transcript_20866/g.48101 Transcript_20866/m.48101 type:complete len:385 (+) Transcript_20866:46-1200(+)